MVFARFQGMWAEARDSSPWCCGNRHAIWYSLKGLCKGQGTPEERKHLLNRPAYVRHGISSAFFTTGITILGTAVSRNRGMATRPVYTITIPLGVGLYVTTVLREFWGHLGDALSDPKYGRSTNSGENLAINDVAELHQGNNNELVVHARDVWLKRARTSHTLYNTVKNAKDFASTLSTLAGKKVAKTKNERRGPLMSFATTKNGDNNDDEMFDTSSSASSSTTAPSSIAAATETVGQSFATAKEGIVLCDCVDPNNPNCEFYDPDAAKNAGIQVDRDAEDAIGKQAVWSGGATLEDLMREVEVANRQNDPK